MRRSHPLSGPDYSHLRKIRHTEARVCASQDSPQTLGPWESTSPLGPRCRKPLVVWEAGGPDRPTRTLFLGIPCREQRNYGLHPGARVRADDKVHRGSTWQPEDLSPWRVAVSPGRLQLWFRADCCSSDSTNHPEGPGQSRTLRIWLLHPLPFLPTLVV